MGLVLSIQYQAGVSRARRKEAGFGYLNGRTSEFTKESMIEKTYHRKISPNPSFPKRGNSFLLQRETREGFGPWCPFNCGLIDNYSYLERTSWPLSRVGGLHTPQGRYPALTASSALLNRILFRSWIRCACLHVGRWYFAENLDATY